MQRIAEDLEGRDDGKAKEAPKSKLQTRRGLSVLAQVLKLLRWCWYRVLREWAGIGYRVPVHPASSHALMGQSCKALRAVHALWTGLAAAWHQSAGRGDVPLDSAAGSSYKRILYTAALCLLSGQAPPPSLAGTGTLTNADGRAPVHDIYSQKLKTSVQTGRAPELAQSVVPGKPKLFCTVSDTAPNQASLPSNTAKLGGKSTQDPPMGSAARCAVHTVDAATGPRRQHSVASAAPDGWR
ncbi:hypothetical protein M441DRAFT_48312 [Trichoderma asperellum CBS 433.97]|uniref:Uncharacterized protein n=1 Tax=Trichoderma asperellum (strain ATCC 204424 / CBS 433.97 / NBRC 101777) TaxID=1042311 RepID=A0A2T3Z2S7_TRIA4|nr:hypothetical protein M441DRAFT_48312 [Trichoderma asperellum CBS 433.97]PTB39114.1 hypothetical protein M441DRAFT_48312 [Trichoderma asperellum CBS 433.97]